MNRAVAHINTDLNHSISAILNLRFDGMLAEAILKKLTNIATSTTKYELA